MFIQRTIISSEVNQVTCCHGVARVPSGVEKWIGFDQVLEAVDVVISLVEAGDANIAAAGLLKPIQ